MGDHMALHMGNVFSIVLIINGKVPTLHRMEKSCLAVSNNQTTQKVLVVKQIAGMSTKSIA